jgi:hypothetical protein
MDSSTGTVASRRLHPRRRRCRATNTSLPQPLQSCSLRLRYLVTSQPFSSPYSRKRSKFHCLPPASASKCVMRTTACASNVPSHYTHPPELSSAGFDSIAGVKRGFEFHDNRPNFYPPPGTTLRSHHNKRESVFSIVFISSYACGLAVYNVLSLSCSPRY